MSKLLTIHGIDIEVEYDIEEGMTSPDYFQPDDPDEIEISAINIGGQDCYDLFEDAGWIDDVIRELY